MSCSRLSNVEIGALRHVIVFLVALMGAPPGAHAAQPILWEDLKDPAAAAFEDPFAALGIHQLRALGTVLRLRLRLEEGPVGAKDRPGIEQQLRSEEAKLAAAGVDVDGLLSQRHEVGRKRAAAALAGNPDLAGREVAITGYVIPVSGPDGTVTTGYLVPGAGMCSHMPAPDPNQMIRYRLSNGWQAQEIYEPVLLSGTLSLKTTRQEITLLDGQVEMLAAFEMDVSDVRSLEGQEPPQNRVLNFFRNFRRQGDVPAQ